MNYDDFDAHTHTIVLESGWDYFDGGKVRELIQTENGWKASVDGSQLYNVVLDGNEGLEGWICDCPYDHGPVCKHVIAVLYAVRNEMDKRFADGLSELDKKALKEIIIRSAVSSRTFRRRLEKQLGITENID